jgi:hypothetical protein
LAPKFAYDLQGFAEVFGVSEGAIQWVLDRSATLKLNALDRDLEIIAKPSSGENDRLNVSVAL